MAEGRVIGRDNKLPWHFKSDLQHFKKLTLGSTVLMGRKTFESIGKPLPGRENFVLSRSVHSAGAPGTRHQAPAVFFNSVEEALGAVKTENCYIIGGGELFAQTLQRIDGIYLTRIHERYEGDAFSPEIPGSFGVTSRSRLQEKPLLEVEFYLKKGA